MCHGCIIKDIRRIGNVAGFQSECILWVEIVPSFSDVVSYDGDSVILGGHE